ncbi:hypothetical protein [Bradyrhizobium sp. dw_411]|uniref:hypothetical protein n=1 Tax=Bradyrhizobium sp. dw_411 TaxID=2720082 RepID=UPI001BCEE781|nr:hypothetical protein [Bradyrhizobium sp. dw_411]
MSDDLRKDVLGWIQSERIDDVAEYAARGRKYAALSDEEAKSQWVHAFQSLANDFVKSQWWQIQIDLSAELELRGLEPPYEQVLEDIEKLSIGLNAAIESKAGDPAAGEASMNRFRAFQSKRTN